MSAINSKGNVKKEEATAYLLPVRMIFSVAQGISSAIVSMNKKTFIFMTFEVIFQYFSQ